MLEKVGKMLIYYNMDRINSPKHKQPPTHYSPLI